MEAIHRHTHTRFQNKQPYKDVHVRVCPLEYVSLFQLNCTSLTHVISTICLPMLLTNQQSYGRAVGSRTDRKVGEDALLVLYNGRGWERREVKERGSCSVFEVNNSLTTRNKERITVFGDKYFFLYTWPSWNIMASLLFISRHRIWKIFSKSLQK